MPSPTTGFHNGALGFDGIDDHVLVQDSPALDFGTGDFSISLYVKTKDLGLSVLLDKRVEYSGPVRGWVAYIFNGNRNNFV